MRVRGRRRESRENRKKEIKKYVNKDTKKNENAVRNMCVRLCRMKEKSTAEGEWDKTFS